MLIFLALPSGMPCRDLAALGLDSDVLAKTADRMQRAANALDFYAQKVLTQGTFHSYGVFSLPLICLDGPEEITLRVLAKSLMGVSGQSYPPRMNALEKIFDAFKEQGHILKKTLHGVCVEKNDKTLLFYREYGRSGPQTCELRPGETIVWDNRYRVNLSKDAKKPLTIAPLGDISLPALGLNTLPCPRAHLKACPALFDDQDRPVAIPPLGWGKMDNIHGKWLTLTLFS
jgi:tRNA(Ile)-lysidine synthase